MKTLARKGHRSLWFFVIALLGSTAPLYAQVSIGSDVSVIDYSRPKDYEIGGITVRGTQYIDQNVLIMLSGLTVGDRIQVPGDKITNAIKKLWNQGLFEDISINATDIQSNKIFLEIYIQERPRMSKFSFSGVKKSEVDDIREKINLTRGDVVNDHLKIRTTNIIKDHFREKGFLNTEVEIDEKPDGEQSNFVSLKINIDKNSKVRIREIVIEGNTQLTDDQIARSMKETKRKGVFNPLDSLGPLTLTMLDDLITLKPGQIPEHFAKYVNDNYKIRIFKGSKFIESNYKDDLDEIIRKYNSNGYRDARIIKDSIYVFDDKNIGIRIWVDEGSQYYFRNIEWVGNTKYTSEFLSTVLGIRKGDIYNRELLETNLNFNPDGYDVSSLYLDNGYLFFNAEPVEIMIENDSIDMEIRIREGKQARINKVSVKGNTKTNDHVVMRQIRSRPGQLFSRDDIIRTTRELAQLRYFNPESITPNINPNPADGTVDIEYVVEETSSDQIELSGGWGYGRIIGTLGLSLNNFSLKGVFKPKSWQPIPTGDGQQLALRFQTFGRGFISYSISFTEPWLGGRKPNALTVSFFHSLFSNGLPRGDVQRSEFIQNGFTIGLQKRLTWPDDYFTLYQGINLTRYDLKNYTTIFVVGTGTGSFNNFSYEIIFGRNSKDQLIYPRSGSDVALGLELTPPYSWFSNKDYKNLDENEKYKWIEYHKWKFRTAWFFELVDKLVLSPRLQFGFLMAYNPDLGVTPFERFFLGGDGLQNFNNLDGRELVSMRGYQNESITPLYFRNTNIGGTIYNRYTLELRYPFSLNPSATIFGLTFFEAGNSWLDIDDFSPFDVYRGVGVGVRVFLPMFGMLGLDWAYGLDPVPGIPTAAGSHFHFSINQGF